MKGTRRLAAAGAALAGIVAAAVTAISLAPAEAAVSNAVRMASNSVTFQDSTGEARGGPDIGTVVVSNDNAGLVSYAITFANRSGFTANDMLLIGLDTDRNATTGDPPYGFDYTVGAMSGDSAVLRWDGVSHTWTLGSMNTLVTSWAGSVFTARINASELGAATGFRFLVLADANPEDADAPVDFAPDVGKDLWAYDVELAPTLAITSIDCTPEPGRRGKPLVGKATVAVTRAGAPEALAPDAVVKWQGTVGTVRLNPTATKVGQNGVLTSTWKVPKTTKAKVFKVTLTVTMDGVTTTKTHLHRIK